MPRLVAPLSLALLGPLATAAHAEVATSGLRETRCALAVHFDGPLVTVRETHDLVGDGPTPAAGRYQFTVPTGAAVTDATVQLGRRTATAIPVLAETLDGGGPATDALALAPDPGVLRWLRGEHDGDVVEAIVHPLTAGATTRLTVRWTAAARYDDGRLQVAVPARGGGPLAPCAVAVTAAPGGGVRRLRAGFVDGQPVALGGRASELANHRPLTIEVEPEWSGPGPIALARSLELGGGKTLTAVALYQPTRAVAPPPSRSRLLIAVDASRSMTADGRAAAVAIADGLIASVPSTTPVEVITFDRLAQRLLGDWTAAGAARDLVRARLRARPAGSGTDLAAALNLIATTVDGEPTRVVIVTDALFSTRVTPTELVGAAMMPAQTTTVDVVVPVIPGAARPERAILEPLTDVFHGKVIAIRTAELGRGLDRLLRRLSADPPVRELAVTIGDTVVQVELPDELPPGSGAVGFALHHGAASATVAVTGRRGGAEISVVAAPWLRSGDALLAAAAGRLASEGAVGPAAALTVARRVRALTPVAGFALIDRAAPGGAARIELATTTGAYQAIAPTLEPGPAEAPRAEAEAAGEVAELPDSTYQLLIKYHLWPGVRTCYRDALRGQPRFAGTLDVTLEIARGEVHAARFGGSPLPSSFVACVAAAAYAMEVPMHRLTGHGEVIAIVRKPIYLRVPDGDIEPELSEDLGFTDAEVEPPPLEPTPTTPGP
jgi:hypothetical protein